MKNNFKIELSSLKEISHIKYDNYDTKLSGYIVFNK